MTVHASMILSVAWLTVWALPAGAEPVRQRQESHPMVLPSRSAPSIQALAVARDQTVYAGSFGAGVFRSEDRGQKWTAVNEGLADSFILSLATADDGAVYVGTFKAGVYRSRDQGKSWQALNDGLTRLQVKALLVDGAVLYAGTGDGAYRLAAGGAKWESVTTGLHDILVHTLAMSSDRTLYVGTSGKGVLRYRADGGRGWTRLPQGLVDHEGLIENFIRVLAIDRDQALYVGTFDGGVFRSSDGGRAWRPISRALPNDSIRGIVPTDSGLYVATGRGIYKTVTQGRQWMPMNKGLAELSVQALVVSRQGLMYAGTNAGVFRSDNQGQNWSEVNEGLAVGAETSPLR